jgi:hypothetical protein
MASVKTDERMADSIRLLTNNHNQLSNWLYPKIYPLHTIYDVC